MDCPFCHARGQVPGKVKAQRLANELAATLEAAKREIPWLRRRPVLQELRERGCTEFVMMGARW